jgi:hypothetical protein
MATQIRKTLFVKKYKIYILLFLAVSAVGFVTLGLPGLTGEIDLQTYSDSLTYERLSKNMPSGVSLISVSSNLVGPIAILRMLDYNYVSVFAFNILVFLASFKTIFSHYDLNKNVFMLFIFVSPLMFFSLFNVNKEILVLFDMAVFLAFLKNRKILYLLLALAVSLLIRWQMTLFILLALPIIFIDKYFRHRKTIVFFLIAGLSVIYPMLSSVFEAVILHSIPDNDAVSGSGIFQKLNRIQGTTGGYLLVFLPKLLQINFGIIKRIHMITEFSLFWNYFVLMLHSVASLILTIFVVIKRRFVFNNFLVYLSMIYAGLFALSPIINIRYFLPMYILLVVVASSKASPQIREPQVGGTQRESRVSQRGSTISTQSGIPA